MTKRIRLLILGCGAIAGSQHIPGVSANPDM
jgi:predicted dehydrogenase